MTMLSSGILRDVSSSYAEKYGVRPRLMGPEGRIQTRARLSTIDELVSIRDARSHALSESVRWGEAYVFFVAPGIISWVVPLVCERELSGGLIGGEVVAEDEPEDRREAVDHLIAAGANRKNAEAYVKRLPAWPQARVQEAADFLYVLFYQFSGWTPMLLYHRREQAIQQRQIAEEIHRRKASRNAAYPHDDERLLLSLIRAGDRKGARRLLNRMLGAVFLRSANLAVVRALMIEMMGYLVRTAVEDSPYLEPLLEKNHQWMARIIESADFEELSLVLREALDDFMLNVYEMGYRPGNAAVRKALSYLEEHYREPVSLKAVAEAGGLSESRMSHLMKEHTGKSILQHVHRMRVNEARRLLEETTTSCADIAYDVGFGDQSYFTKHFRLITGTTPARYRRSARA